MQVLIWGLKCLLSMLRCMLGSVKGVKKTTAVVESLSTIQPDVLFQRLPAYFQKRNKIGGEQNELLKSQNVPAK